MIILYLLIFLMSINLIIEFGKMNFEREHLLVLSVKSIINRTAYMIKYGYKIMYKHYLLHRYRVKEKQLVKKAQHEMDKVPILKEDDALFSVIDTAIEDSLRYYVMLINIKDFPIVTQKIYDMIHRDIYTDIMTNLSPAYMNKLKLYYTEKGLKKYIERRMFTTINVLTAEINGRLRPTKTYN